MGVFRVQNRSVPIQSATLIIGPILEQWLKLASVGIIGAADANNFPLATHQMTDYLTMPTTPTFRTSKKLVVITRVPI